MSAPIIPKRVNKKIFNAIYNECIAHVELMPRSQELLNRRDELIAEIEGRVPRKVSSELSDLYITIACQFGEEMLRLGIAFGTNPGAILDLPDGE